MHSIFHKGELVCRMEYQAHQPEILAKKVMRWSVRGHDMRPLCLNKRLGTLSWNSMKLNLDKKYTHARGGPTIIWVTFPIRVTISP